MKKRGLLFTCTVWLTAHVLQAQPYAPEEKHFKNQVTLLPSRVMDMVHPGFAISYERLYAHQKFSTQLTGGYITDVFKVTTNEHMSGYMFSLQQKYFFSTEKEINTYFSAEVGHFNSRSKTSAFFGDEFPYLNDSNHTYVYSNYEDTFSVHKRVTAFSIKYGLQTKVKRFVFDFSFGLGIRLRHATHHERLIPSDPMERPRHPNFPYAGKVEGRYATINIPVSFRIGYCF